MDRDKLLGMSFRKVYDCLVAKAERKSRTKAEVDEVICWLTGYSTSSIEAACVSGLSYGDFFRNAPQMNPNRKLITGSICGIKVQDIEDPLIQDIRYLDKLVDELAKGKPMESILRSADSALWTCPTCGRTFKRKNQSHYCGNKPKTIDEYILQQAEPARPCLRAIRETIRGTLPDAEEKISWSMPTYSRGKNLIQFAASKNHIGLYPGPEAVERFSDELDTLGLKHSKGTIRIPYQEKATDLPLELVARIATWCQERA